jgi:hypothetical protein
MRRDNLAQCGVAGLGGLICIVGMFVDPARTASAYLVAYVSCLSAVLGMLALIMIARVSGATWFVALRRQAEQVVATLPLFAVLFIPLSLSTSVLYPWARPAGAVPVALASAIASKHAYLNVTFFLARTIFYFAVWIGLGEFLRRASLAQDAGESPRIELHLGRASAVGLVAFGLTVTFAAFDWTMSLTPEWSSTIYGVDYFAGGMVAALALLAIVTARGRAHGEFPEAVGANHFHVIGKVLLTFILFWVYIGFAQFIVIWSAELPNERGWYATRLRGGWELLAAIILLGHFVIPFSLLLVRSFKRSARAMAAIGAGLLVMHFLDSYWNVMPDAPRGTIWGAWLDIGALMFIAGAASLEWSVRRRGERTIPTGDPDLASSLVYSTE